MGLQSDRMYPRSTLGLNDPSDVGYDEVEPGDSVESARTQLQILPQH